MNRNLDEIFVRAANSNLTPTAIEFVPRATFNFFNSSQSESSQAQYNFEANKRQGAHFNSRDHFDQLGFSFENSGGRGFTPYHIDKYVSQNNYREKSDRRFTPNDRLGPRRPSYEGQESYYDNKPPHFKPHPRNDHSLDVRPFSNNYKEDKRFNRNHRDTFDHSQHKVYKNQQGEGSSRSYSPRNAKVNRCRTDTNFEESSYSEASNFMPSLLSENSLSKPSSNNIHKFKPREDVSKFGSYKKKSSDSDQSVSQRDRLIEQLNNGTLECLVCCDTVKQREPVWNCTNCRHVLHMWCTIKWARSSKKESSNWRCPACQDEKSDIPEKYMCFCGKTKLQTDWNRIDTAHSCGEVCGRSKDNPTPWFICEHRCTLLCHPGPCPPCTIQVSRECGCGRTTRTVQCSTKTDLLCGSICDRLLNCGQHYCLKPCHFGECGACCEKIKNTCYCGRKTTEVVCSTENLESKFSCQEKCDRVLSCGNHKCNSICHEGECSLCPRSSTVLNTCACGKTTPKENLRTSCLDPVPTCDQVCHKVLSCGPSNKPHMCESKCHEDDCPPCTKQTIIKCRCGASEKSVSCVELAKEGVFKCQKKCAKKRSCGKHKCNQVCCIDVNHVCQQRCSGTMSCGKHRCELLCHRGKCGRCLQSSFEELYCHCGSSVIYPPVPCGTKPPVCDKPCRREHDCDHSPLHTCHSDRECPPCIVFTDKLCYGGHELRKTIPCYQNEFSCGLPCGAPLPCGLHKCLIPCHPGNCLSTNKKCTQPCTKARELCGHPCATPCHSGVCPNTPCRELVKVTCACGNLVVNHQCHEHTDDYRRIISATLAEKMTELQISNSVNISDINEKINAQKINLRTLECNDECKFIMRNRRLALALQIQNPDLNAKLTPKYSDFMKSWAKKDPSLCRNVHDRLTELVKLAKESKQKSRSYSFEVMNKEKRQLVHEYCAHFGCESEAYDAEPKRNVVAIAVKGRCWLPSYSVLEVVQREMGQRRVPIPVFNRKIPKKGGNNSAVPRTIILPVLPSASSSHSGINYFVAGVIRSNSEQFAMAFFVAFEQPSCDVQ